MSFSSVYQSSVSLTIQVTLDPINQSTFQVNADILLFFFLAPLDFIKITEIQRYAQSNFQKSPGQY